eukprot:SAG22_NODE_267_length_13330_cov_19.960396_3_plen_113_part_00
MVSKGEEGGEEIDGTDRYGNLGMQCCCSKAVTFTSTHKLRRRNCSQRFMDLAVAFGPAFQWARPFAEILVNCKFRLDADTPVFLDPGPTVFRQSKAFQALTAQKTLSVRVYG